MTSTQGIRITDCQDAGGVVLEYVGVLPGQLKLVPVCGDQALKRVADNGEHQGAPDSRGQVHAVRPEGEVLGGLVKTRGGDLATLESEENLTPGAGGRLVDPAVEQVPARLIHQGLLHGPGELVLHVAVFWAALFTGRSEVAQAVPLTSLLDLGFSVTIDLLQ